jgi:hypothetical protein
MPSKKSAKKSAKRSGNKDEHHDKHHEVKDLRRAYEHLGRVEALQHSLGDLSEEAATSVHLAQQEFASGATRNAAELLRAAEHFCFAALLKGSGDNRRVAGKLEMAIRDEFERLAGKAEEDWDGEAAHPAIAHLYTESLSSARLAQRAGADCQAMELVRAAEALAHVKAAKRPVAKPAKPVAARSNVRELAAS